MEHGADELLTLNSVSALGAIALGQMISMHCVLVQTLQAIISYVRS